MPLSRRQVLAAGVSLPATLAACRSKDALLEPGASRETAPAPAGSRRVREVKEIAPSEPTMEGAGVRLRRALGTRALPLLDPFLMLDEFRTDRPEDYEKGFPSHPHRGFETVTYMVDGAMEHQDSLGNRGRLGPGGAQWMTAGRGIIHSEMPKQERGRMWGYQLWVNLPASDKMTKPRYQDLAPESVVETTVADARVRLVAGELAGKRGPVSGIATAPLFFDAALGPRGKFEQALPPSHNAFVYVIEGSVRFGAARAIGKHHLAVLGPGDRVAASSDDGGRFLLFAGRPLGEPVARRGPFVMNTEEQIRQAIEDYRTGRLVDG